MIVEERTYHVHTGRLPEVVRLYAEEGTEVQQRYLGNLIGAFTVDIGDLSSIVQMWGYESLAERERRRAELQADDAWKAFLVKIQPLIHTQRNRILLPTSFSPDPMSRLAGKVAVVTGGAQGIGRAIAEGLAADGARIVIADLQGAEEAATAFPDGVGLTADVSAEDDVARMTAETIERCGTIDVLVNNAGLYASLPMRPFDQIPVAEWRAVMDVNVLSMFLTCRAVVPHMRRQGGGRIVNISSGTPFRGVPFLLHYVTSKGAIVAFTRALAKELGGDEILVNCVAPGFTMSAGVRENPEVVEALRDVSVSSRTLRRDQEPEDVVGAVVFLCGPGSEFVTGQTMVIDGGQFFH